MVKEVTLLDKDEYLKLGLLINNNFEKLYNLESLLNSEYDKIFGYFEDNVLRAFIHVRVLYETVEIINIVVGPLYRRKGIATLLLKYIMNIKEIKEILLEVNINNEVAIKTYEKNGFKVISERKNYYGSDTALIMKRDV